MSNNQENKYQCLACGVRSPHNGPCFHCGSTAKDLVSYSKEEKKQIQKSNKRKRRRGQGPFFKIN